MQRDILDIVKANNDFRHPCVEGHRSYEGNNERGAQSDVSIPTLGDAAVTKYIRDPRAEIMKS
jgi:hypothetical protein